MQPSAAAGEPEGPPLHVRTAFGVREAEPRPRPHLPGPAWACDAVLLRPVSDTVLAAWSAATVEELSAAGVDGVRLARPVRASDGRRVVSGWAACHDVAGQVRPRHDDVVAVSLRLHRATAKLSRPRFVDDRDDILARADRMAFGERTVTLDAETGGDLFAEVVDAERSGPRVVTANEHWTAFVPAAARWPYEVQLFPTRQVPDIPELTDAERTAFVEVYLDVLGRFARRFERPMPYIAAWNQAPVRDGRADWWLHLQLFSLLRAPGKLKYLAGSESGMGAFITDTNPEDVAEQLRAVVVA